MYLCNKKHRLTSIDDYFNQHCHNLQCSYSCYSFDQDMQLVKADGTCDAIESWQHHGATAGGQRLTSGNVDQSSIVEVCYPDWHYCKNPRDLRAAVEAGGEIIFEGGAVHGWVADSARNHNLQHRHWHLI